MLNANPACTLDGEISIQINIDVLPLFKSTNDKFLPILGMLDRPSIRKPFIIGLFYGPSKPNNVTEYLKSFVDELKHVQADGLEYEGQQYTVSLSAVICDAPARAFVKQIKSHCGYSGCDKCIQPGVWNGKMKFPEMISPLRSNIQLNEMQDEDHNNNNNNNKTLFRHRQIRDCCPVHGCVHTLR